MPKDNKARYGSRMNWDKQKNKQQEVADSYYARHHGEVITLEELEEEEGGE